MTDEQHDELERSYDVPDGAVLPDLAGVADGWTTSQPTEVRLEAVYYDTADLALAGHGATLRRRTGGEDEGWHLKLPRSADLRAELHRPLGEPGEPPADLLSAVRAQVRDKALAPLAAISTRRLQRRLLDGEGTVRATVCDDEVRAQRLVGAARELAWREWEVEVADPSTDGADLLDLVEARLVDAGARRSPAPSKLARVVGDLVPDRGPDPADLAGEVGVRDLLASHLGSLEARLHRQDARLRAGEDDAVHRMRIAARRIRSALRTCKRLLDPEPSEALATELQWLGRVLAGARDAQVMRQALLDLVRNQPDELVVGPIADRVDDTLRKAEATGRDRALEALDDERYLRLLDRLEAFAAAPPLTTDPDEPAADVLPRLLRRDTKRLQRAVDAVRASDADDERDAALHEVRKKAKRLRYAAELATPVLGKPARRLARRSKKVQQALGRHQDAVVARRELRALGMRAHLDGQNSFTYGRLHALQERAAEAAERDFERAWDRMPSG